MRPGGKFLIIGAAVASLQIVSGVASAQVFEQACQQAECWTASLVRTRSNNDGTVLATIALKHRKDGVDTDYFLISCADGGWVSQRDGADKRTLSDMTGGDNPFAPDASPDNADEVQFNLWWAVCKHQYHKYDDTTP
jgi:hypothetical protein